MKKLWIILVISMLFTGCMTANQLAGEKAYYEMLVAIGQNRGPLLDIKIADPTKPANIERIVVNMPSSQDAAKQYIQKDYVQPWLNIVGAAMPWFATWGIVKAVGDAAGSTVTNYNQSVSGTGNSASLRTVGNMDIGNITGNGNTVGGLIDQTSPPTIVTQPAPIVIEQPPPVVVSPAIVTQPPPVVVPPSYAP
jgi:hypothetical protein